MKPQGERGRLRHQVRQERRGERGCKKHQVNKGRKAERRREGRNGLKRHCWQGERREGESQWDKMVSCCKWMKLQERVGQRFETHV